MGDIRAFRPRLKTQNIESKRRWSGFHNTLGSKVALTGPWYPPMLCLDKDGFQEAVGKDTEAWPQSERRTP